MSKQNPLTRTEALANKMATGKGYQVWRGRYAGFVHPAEQVFDCVLVGLSDAGDPPPVSAVVLAISFDHSGSCRINAEDYSAFIPDDPWDTISDRLQQLLDLNS
jgi:hypothetical protein